MQNNINNTINILQILQLYPILSQLVTFLKDSDLYMILLYNKKIKLACENLIYHTLCKRIDKKYDPTLKNTYNMRHFYLWTRSKIKTCAAVDVAVLSLNEDKVMKSLRCLSEYFKLSEDILTSEQIDVLKDIYEMKLNEFIHYSFISKETQLFLKMLMQDFYLSIENYYIINLFDNV